MTEAGPSSRPLDLNEYKRYGRQMIMPEWGLPGQTKLKQAKVVVVGAGGLGCPTLQYLAGSGVGQVTIIDHDTVDVSNLHRQILHSTDRVGMNKAESAVKSLSSLNPHVHLKAITEPITPSNAIDLLTDSDIIVDCTDRPLTRYLLSDAAVILDKPLVSGAAISSSGQWAVYGGTTRKGKKRACYRCMWPAVVGDGGGKCSEVGVWGPVTGFVGSALAGEALRLIIGQEDPDPMLHMLHFGGVPMMRSIKLRSPSVKCIACGPNRTITSLEQYDYDEFCSGTAHEDLEEPTPTAKRLTPKELQELLRDDSDGVAIIDTRPPTEFGICSIPTSKNIPLQDIISHPESLSSTGHTVFVCRQGVDSAIAARAVAKVAESEGAMSGETVITDLKGGLVAWSKEVDPQFPIY